jgi:hypothetical protein
MAVALSEIRNKVLLGPGLAHFVATSNPGFRRPDKRFAARRALLYQTFAYAHL